MILTPMRILLAFVLGAAVLGAGAGVMGVRTASFAGPDARPAAPPRGEDDADRPAKTFKLDGKASEAHWSADGKVLVTVTRRWERAKDAAEDDPGVFYTTIQIWNGRTGEQVASLGEVKDQGIVAVEVAPDGKTFAFSRRRTIQDGDHVEVWDAAKGERITTVDTDYGRMAPHFTFSPDGKTVALVYGGPPEKFEGGVRLFDVATGKRTQYLTGHENLVLSVAFSPDGGLLATGGERHDGKIRIWDRKTEKVLHVLDAPTGAIAMQFSPDGKTLLAGLGEGLRAWDVKTGEEEAAFDGAAGDSFWGVAWSPDGARVAGAGMAEKDGKKANQVKLWDARTGKLLRTWTDTSYSSLTFTPDGAGLAILHADGTVKVWDVKDK
jgi:WD40 repeat protein